MPFADTRILIPEYDLTHPEAVARPYDEAHPQLVIHLAATVGGIGANRENPGRFFYENLMMGAQRRGCRAALDAWNDPALSPPETAADISGSGT